MAFTDVNLGILHDPAEVGTDPVFKLGLTAEQKADLVEYLKTL